MESPEEDCVSPESTVTSLLSSSGRLRSSLQPPELSRTFQYGEQIYDSASAALEAYIADFDGSCQRCRTVTGPLVLATPRKPRAVRPRNRDVLRERLTERELDFLNLPVSSPRHRQNRDRVSMTTDELLAIPFDGSMPITHTSAFMQGLLSRSGTSQMFHPSTQAQLSSSRVAPKPLDRTLDQNCPPAGSSRHRGEPESDPSVDRGSSPLTAADLHLPHWLTSNKAHMDGSEISSLPDLQYPAWVRHCSVSDPELRDQPDVPGGEDPGWTEAEEPQAGPRQVGGEETLRALRLQLAQQISAMAAGGTGSDEPAAWFRGRTGSLALLPGNRMEALIQKADQVLDSLSSGGAERSAGQASVGTDDLPLSWSRRHRPDQNFPALTRPCRTFTAAAELEAGQNHQDTKILGHGNSSWKQPGPLEAMKQLLFRLEAVEAELQRRPVGIDCLKTPEKEAVEGEADLQSFPGSPSLQRALHHLKRLKLLVEEPGQERRRRDEEKDEDEGRYSSSTERLLSRMGAAPDETGKELEQQLTQEEKHLEKNGFSFRIVKTD
ncbi:lung adenoma susceptibility protein 2 isoform X2 [Cyprinodon tularosa]|uniref:lung adenoma susceptibility protein 2 isoform X2 n=1 Tax=Cyprinodon tularosa TaxID=77115 RepID=UPI0018E26E87|nr:lung adenoma susceptibility protein 2 isoform X2 [Cyprinodon tularosa]